MQRKRVLANAVKKISKKARTQKPWVPKIDLGPEKKSLDTYATGTFSYTGGSPGVVLLNGIAAGTNSLNRVGRKVLMKSLELRFTISTNATAINSYRVLVVYDKQANQAAPSFADVLSTLGDSLDPFKSRNQDNIERFQVLMDKFFVLSSGDVIAHATKEYIPMNHPVRFDSNSGAIADITSGSLYFMFIDGNTGAVVSTCSYAARLKFTDL